MKGNSAVLNAYHVIRLMVYFPPKPSIKGIFGILNITDDSFSDGGKYLSPESASARVKELWQAGADVIDIGAVSSNPSGQAVDATTEISRIMSVWGLFAGRREKLSVDTFNSVTQRHFIEQGAGWINDIRGFADVSVYDHLKNSTCKLIVMHAVQSGGRADYTDTRPDEIFNKIEPFFEMRLNRLLQAGISRERIVIDPGMGFFLGTNPECSLTVMRQLEKLHRFGFDIMLSVSKKSFLRNISGLDIMRIGYVNLCAEIISVLKGATYIRTHEPAPLSDALKFLLPFFGNER